MNLFARLIHRPVATTLIAVAITLFGIIGFKLLPVASLPRIDFPIIVVSASIPGAAPEIMASSVATPLEKALSHVAGINEMTSTSSLGSTRIILQFDLERDINGAARDVQAAINAAQNLLPADMPNRPTYRKVNPSDSPIIILALTSEVYSQGQLYDLASSQLAPKLSQLEGVGDLTVAGSSLPAIRVKLNPHALFSQGISLDAVRQSINNANTLMPAGTLETTQHHWQLDVNGELKTATDYKPLIIRYRQGAVIRLQDVAEVVDSVQDVRNAGMVNTQPAISLIIRRSPDANIIETVDRIKSAMPQLQTSLPASVELAIALDRSPTIRASLLEMERALAIAVALVILVVFFFLRSGRATFIPIVVIPVSLIGTFSALYLCNFSLNHLSLMALTVATGFVVDDAIVVLENISRHLEKGMKPLNAALKGTQEVAFTVLSMSVSLIAVFIPLLLMGGIPGRLFREFSVTLAVAIAISLSISLTLTPVLCAYLLRSSHALPQKKLIFFIWLQTKYAGSLQWALNHGRWVLILFVCTVVLNIGLYIQIPKTLFPEQDTGQIMGFIRADQDTSFQAMREKLTRFMQIVHEDPDVSNVIGNTGGSQTNSGNMFITLKPLNERKFSVQAVIARLRTQLANEPGARLHLSPVQDVRAGGRQANANYQFTLLSDEVTTLRTWAPKIESALAQSPELADVSSDQQTQGVEMALTYDRDAMKQLGISVTETNTLLNNAFGQRQISTLFQPLNQYKVIMELADQYTQDSSTLDYLFVINQQGQPVPLSYFAKWHPVNSALAINHQGLSAAATITFNLPEGKTLSDATESINHIMVNLGVPSTVSGVFAGTAKLFQDTLKSQLILILAAIAAIYIVLGILYESYVHPLTILSTLPSAGIGALLALELFATPFSLIALIGILLLIGIVKKNAIMMVDFALTAERTQNMLPRNAIFQACLLRFRPIMMTSLAAICGALPLMLGSGDGAELRQPLGITIVGGLLVSQLLTLYTTPVIYLYFDRLRKKTNPKES